MFWGFVGGWGRFFLRRGGAGAGAGAREAAARSSQAKAFVDSRKVHAEGGLSPRAVLDDLRPFHLEPRAVVAEARLEVVELRHGGRGGSAREERGSGASAAAAARARSVEEG